MQMTSRILGDLAQVAGGTMGLASGLSQNIRADIKARIDEAVSRLDLVPREDLDALKAMLEQSRIEQETLKQRLDTLEKKRT